MSFFFIVSLVEWIRQSHVAALRAKISDSGKSCGLFVETAGDNFQIPFMTLGLRMMTRSINTIVVSRCSDAELA